MTLALEIEKQRAEAKFETLRELVRDGILTIKVAAERAGLSEDTFRQQAML